MNPTPDEINTLVETLHVEPDFIRDPLDDEERSRVEYEDGNVLIIIDIPDIVYEEDGTTTYETLPLGIIVHEDYFVTVTLKENPIFERFIHQRIRNFYTFKKTRFTFQLLDNVSAHFLRYLKQISRRTDEIEDHLHESMKNEEIFKMLGIEKSLVYFTTSLKSNNVVLQKILRGKYLKMYEDDEDILEDVIIEVKQAIEMSETYSHILNGMMNAYSSVISNNLNIAMKFLTSVTVVLAIPTMISSFFGMNTQRIPFSNVASGFYIILSISTVLSIIIGYIFKRKKYF